MPNGGGVTTSTESTHTFTVAEASQLLGVSERTIWRYLKSGRLEGETVGPSGSQRTLIARHSVDDLRAERGRDPEVEVLRAERDRLIAELAQAQAEREALRARVDAMHRAISHRKSFSDRAADGVRSALTRVGRPGGARRPAAG